MVVASVDDDFDASDELVVVLRSDLDGNLDPQVVVHGQTLELTVTEPLTAADPTLTLSVFDRGGLVGSDQVDLAVVRNEAPRITSLSPVDGENFADTPHIYVELTVEDDGLDPTALSLDWHGLPDQAACGQCAWPDAPGSDGVVGFYLDLADCEDQNATRWFVLGLTVTDPEGLTDVAEHAIGLSCEL